MGYFYSIVNTYTSKWTHNGKVKLKLVRPEEKKKGLWYANLQECEPCTALYDMANPRLRINQTYDIKVMGSNSTSQ